MASLCFYFFQLSRKLHIDRDETLILCDMLCLKMFQEEILYEWINPIYMDMSAQANIQEQFEEKSEILLKNFFKVSVWQALIWLNLENATHTWIGKWM